MPLDLDTHALRVVLAVADEQSFRAAAERLGIAQSSVSRAVGDVERRTRTTIFDRSHRVIVVTPEGASIVGLAQRLVGQVDQASRTLAELRAGERGHVVVAALPSLAATVLPAALRHLRSQAPAIDVDVRDVPAAEVERLVSQGSADVGLSTAPLLARDDLVLRPLVRDQLGCVLPPDHRLARQDSVAWTDVEAEPTVEFRAGTSVAEHVQRGRLASGTQARPVATVGTVATAAALVVAGYGVAIVPALVLPLMAGFGLEWRPLAEPVIRREIHIMVSAGGRLSQATSTLLDAFRASPARREGDGLLWLD